MQHFSQIVPRVCTSVLFISKVFYPKKEIKTVCCIWLLWRHFCISRIQIDEGIASTTCVEAKKEALASRILQVRQLLTPPGTSLIDNATILNAMCDHCCLSYETRQVLVEEPNRLNTEL